MRFYTKEECEERLRGRNRVKPDSAAGLAMQHVDYPDEPYRIFALAHWIASSITYRMDVLLWITEWDIWPSSENWHLYYKLRQGYGDLRLLHEAPGHLFLAHESEDLASFLQIAMLNGWGGYVLPHAPYVSAFFSHDEYINFYAESEADLAEVRTKWGAAQDERLRVADPRSHTGN